MSATGDRDRKIKALLSKTVGRGCTPGEQASAMSLALRICADYGIAPKGFKWPKPPRGWKWAGSEVVEKPAGKRERKPRAVGDRVQKAGLVIGLVSKQGGATTQELLDTTGWLPHTLRAFFSHYNKRPTDKREGTIVSNRDKATKTTTYSMV